MRGYRPATRAQLDALGAAGMLLYANRRYGNTYAIDRPALDHILARGHAQIVHVGQVAGLHALSSYPAKWLTVLLWCPRPISAARLRDRDDNAIAARLAAWDVTYRDVLAAPPGAFGLALRTDHLTPAETARRIDAANRDPHSPPAAADVAEVIAGP